MEPEHDSTGEPESPVSTTEPETVSQTTEPVATEPEAPKPVDPLATYEGRAAIVAAMGGNLEEHLCCPKCFDQRAIKEGDKAKCDVCGWTGLVINLLDTVQTGATKLV